MFTSTNMKSEEYLQNTSRINSNIATAKNSKINNTENINR